MKFAIVPHGDRPGSPWEFSYEQMYEAELRKQGHTVTTVTLREAAQLGKDWFVWPMHYEDLDALPLPRPKSRLDASSHTAYFPPNFRDCFVISQSNWSSASPYLLQVDTEREARQMKYRIDFGLCFDEKMMEAMRERFPDPIFIANGFPVHVPDEYKGWKKKEGKIVMAGRATPDKQWHLALYLLGLLRHDPHYEIVFCWYDHLGGREHIEKYMGGVKALQERGVTVFEANRHEYLMELADAEFYFNCSLGDTGSVSVAEALMCGCYPLLPDSPEAFPCYSRHIEGVGTYPYFTPFLRSDLMRLVEEKPDFHWKRYLSDVSYCAKTLVEALELYLG